MSQTENTIELVSITKIPYVGSGSADRFVKGFKCLKKDLDNLPVTDDMASGSFADALDTGDHAEYSAVTNSGIRGPKNLSLPSLHEWMT